MADEKQRTPPALARTRTLAERSATDLKLAHDAALAAGMPFVDLSKLMRARREVKDLLKRIEAHARMPHDVRVER